MSIGVFSVPTMVANGTNHPLTIPISNHSMPSVFHGIGGIGGDPTLGVFTSSGGPIGQGKFCKDLNGRKIPSGVHYVPGPDECTLCVCEDGEPKWCKAVLCSPPQDCKSFRVGNSCCDFICLDDSLNKGNGNGKTGGPFNGPLDLADVVPKIIVVAITAILSLSLLLFLIHRLRQKQIQGRLNSSVARRCDDCDDSRSLDFSMDYFDRGPPPPSYLAWWKPPSSYFPPRGEAPPPYEEAIASTSNCLPTAFTSVFNNNSIANNITNDGLNRSTVPVAPAPTTNATITSTTTSANTTNVDTNGIETTSLSTILPTLLETTNEVVPIINSSVTTAFSSQGDNPLQPVPLPQGSPKHPEHQQLRVDGNPTVTIAKESQGSRKKSSAKKERPTSLCQVQRNHYHHNHHRTPSSQSHGHDPQPGPSSSSISRLNETEHLRNAGSVVPTINDLRFPLRGFINPPVPPAYDDAMMLQYGREYFRHSLTLPRRADFIDRANDYCRDEGFRRNQQQRFSLQFNVADWSSDSSSTLSLSTPNSPNGLCRPPSLSSSSSSNVSHTHV